MKPIFIHVMSNHLEPTTYIELDPYFYASQGLEGVYEDLEGEQDMIQHPGVTSKPYLDTVYNEQVAEKSLDAETCKKLLKKKK